MANNMKKYKVSLEAIILVWFAFVILLGVGLFVIIMGKWDLVESLILCGILELPTLISFPIVYQTVKIDDEKASLCLWFITFRSIPWSEVAETGIAYTRAGYGTYKKFIYISKRPVTDKERFDILHVKDHKNFITMENRGNIIEDLKKYSKLPFRDLPTAEDFSNM